MTFQLSETSEGDGEGDGGPDASQKISILTFPQDMPFVMRTVTCFFHFQFRVNVAQSRGRERGSEEGGRGEGNGGG